MRAQSSPVAAQAPALQGLTQRELRFFICLCMFSAAKGGFEGAVLGLAGVLDAEGDFWLLLTCCEISGIRLRTNIIEHQ